MRLAGTGDGMRRSGVHNPSGGSNVRHLFRTRVLRRVWTNERALAGLRTLTAGCATPACRDIRNYWWMTRDALSYAREIAPEQVRLTLDWLETEGFSLKSATGGRTASFGDVCLDFVGIAVVRVVRDRSQWHVDVGPSGGTRRFSVAVLDAARRQVDWVYPTLEDGELPEMLPPGVVWTEVVPAVVEWIGRPGSVEAAELTDSQARQVMAERLGLG